MRRGREILLATLALGLLGGCLGEPEIEDRWTRLDFLETTLGDDGILNPDSTEITVNGRVTYRSQITGSFVAEIRVSSTLTAEDLQLHADADRLQMAYDIDSVLLNSQTAGRATRPLVGWDHLMREVEVSFSARIPTLLDSTGAPTDPTGIFLIAYLGEEEEIELEDGRDSILVTPFLTRDFEILPVGMPVIVSDGATGP